METAHRGNLLPSIMPIPTTAPPSASKPFPLPPNLRRPSRRDALGAIDRNTTLPSVAIPRPAAHPDVFAASSPKRLKRPLETNNGPAKRPRFEEAVDKARVKKIDERWVSRWLKMFPTLVIHFEVEDAAGRVLKQRVVKLGATVDPFFSHTVTHLITKNVASPQKTRPVSHLATKAVDMGIKVWSLKKLGELVANISPVELAATDSLRTLLEDERLHGTRERDLSAPRPDHYYFKPGNKYTLIEDATGRHRPIMVKEYPPAGKEAEWPVLHETFLRISAPNLTDTPVDKLRERAWSLYVDNNQLRRATSMRNIAGTPELPQPAPYQIASGNSVVITSNIASTSNANPSPFPTGLGAMKTITQLSKRVQVLKGNARLAAKRNQPNDLFAPAPRRASTGMPLQQKTFMTQDQVVKMLRQARQPVNEDGVTREMRIVNHERVYGMAYQEAPGYCENCRLRYTDLSIHLASKKHRRFAHNPLNFTDLDRLLVTLCRPGFSQDTAEDEYDGEDGEGEAEEEDGELDEGGEGEGEEEEGEEGEGEVQEGEGEETEPESAASDADC